MNPNINEMQGSPMNFGNAVSEHFGPTHLLGGGIQPHYDMVDPLRLHQSSFGSQEGLYEQAGWPTRLESDSSQHPNEVTNSPPISRCRFSCDILDNCSKSRFYARALEFFLIDEKTADWSRCMFSDCLAQDFKSAESMLRHLKHCKCFDKGEFRCPICSRYESFKIRSGSRCGWDKEHIGEKVVRTYKKFIRDFSSNKLCRQCSTSLGKDTMPSASQETHSTKDHDIVQPNSSDSAIGRSGAGSCELHHEPCRSELSGDSPVPSSRSAGGFMSPNRYTPSEMPSATTSTEDDHLHSEVSPRSSASAELAGVTHRPSVKKSIGEITRRLTGRRKEVNAGSGIARDHSVSLYNNAPTNYGFEYLDPMSVGPFDGTPSLSSTLSTRVNPRDLPELRVDTALGYTVPAPQFQMPMYQNGIVDYSTTMEIHTATSLPTNIVHQQSNAMSSSTMENWSLGDNALIISNVAPKYSPSLSPFTMSNSQETSPNSSPSDQGQLECPEPGCNHRTKGKPESAKAYLRKHMSLRHGGKPTIPCSHDGCDKTFTRIDNMGAHHRREHSNSSSPSKRRRSSADSSAAQPKRRNAVRGRKPAEFSYLA
ncbi:hypothetical protein F4808DRAFT_264941 [Astrocystis sublimbata]|nr:hypothetical protein F4808DRAFT_264941 [Astrocystis sublimbata]